METNLSKIRKKRNISQKELAIDAKVNIRTLQAYESGIRDINKASAETVYRLAEKLNCRMESILNKNLLNYTKYKRK